MVEYIKRDAQSIHGTPFVWLPSERDYHVPSCFPIAFIHYKDKNSSHHSQSNNNHRYPQSRDRTSEHREAPPSGYRRSDSFSRDNNRDNSQRRPRDNSRDMNSRDNSRRGRDRDDDRREDDYPRNGSYGRRERNDSYRSYDRKPEYDRSGLHIFFCRKLWRVFLFLKCFLMAHIIFYAFEPGTGIFFAAAFFNLKVPSCGKVNLLIPPGLSRTRKSSGPYFLGRSWYDF